MQDYEHKLDDERKPKISPTGHFTNYRKNGNVVMVRIK